MTDPLLKNHADMMLAVEAGYDYAPNIAQDMADRIENLEAKLESAVESLTRIDDLTCHNMPMTAREEQAVNREVRAALEKLKGQDDAVLHGD